MTVKFIKVLTEKGYITLNRMQITTIDPVDTGTRIVLIPLPYSEEPVTLYCKEPYETVLEYYFSV